MSEAFNGHIMARLRKMGVEEPVDLIRNLPVNYDDFTIPMDSLPSILRLPHGQSFYARLKLESVKSGDEMRQEKINKGESAPRKGGVPFVRIEFTDGLRKSSTMVFGRIDPWLDLRKTSLNKIIHVSGKVSHKSTDRGDFINLTSVAVVPPADQNRIVARYRGKEKVITPEKVADLTLISTLHYVGDAVEQILDQLGVSEEVAISQCRIPFENLEQMLKVLHKPDDKKQLEMAIKSARRLSAYYGIRKALDATMREPNPDARMAMDRDLISSIVKQHPFTPTKDQRQAIWDIICDLDQDTPMDRLLSADVGNGKTMAYGIPAAYVSKKGKNTVVMLPTEPLAGQVAQNIQQWYPETKVHLATSGFKGDVKQGDILIGTTALLNWIKNNPEWKVDFAIVDEQQKMGTAQRDALNNMGTHILEATATPIPRTMAQTIFGHKKVSLIKDCPVEKNISSKLLGNTQPEKIEAFRVLNEWVDKGKKVVVIYPLVAEQQGYYFHINAEDIKAAEKISKLIKKSSLNVKWVKPFDDEDAQLIMSELDNSAEFGFVAEFHGEEDAFKRLMKRAESYLGESQSSVRFLGSHVDSDLEDRNKATILRNRDAWEKKRPGKVAMIHGRSKRSEKIDIINKMNSGEFDVLISTTLVEIGVDIKDACSLLVINAEQLGAYTLHQLRGRLARNGGEADFMMMAGCPLDELEDVTRDRLDLLIKFKNGDDIAMHDMEQRGFGNLSAGGKSQKGFEDGLFPSIKLTPSELNKFLKELSRDVQADASSIEP